jgi:DNA polymerase-4
LLLRAVATRGTAWKVEPDALLPQAVQPVPTSVLARQLKQRIHAERGLTATIGVAANKLLAKIASDHRKPDGLTLITEKEKAQFLRPLPVRALYGVGHVTEGVLRQVGLSSVADLQDYRGDLRALVGSFGPTLKRFAFGQDDRSPELGDEVKSVSGEETFLKIELSQQCNDQPRRAK